MIEPVEILDAGSAHVTGTWRDVAFIVWRGAAPALLALDQTNRVMDWASQLGGKFGFLAVVEPNAPLPGAAARGELNAGMKRFAPQLRAGGVLLEGEGFWVAAARGVVTGMNTVVPPSFPNRIFATADEAATFMVERMGYEAGARVHLLEALQHLRAVPDPSARR